MKKVIALTSTLLTTSIVSMSAAIASPPHVTTSGAPAAWKTEWLQLNSTPKNSTAQPSNQNKPADVRDKEEVKPLESQAPIQTSNATRCTGDARSATPPVVNNPHHLRNVVWRNQRMNCVR